MYWNKAHNTISDGKHSTSQNSILYLSVINRILLSYNILVCIQTEIKIEISLIGNM